MSRPPLLFRAGSCALLLGSWLVMSAPAPAVILYDTGDPTANTTAPTGSLAGSGWQYEGEFSVFLGTAIAPNFFITAAHLGGAAVLGVPFVYHGVSYATVAAYPVNGTDLFMYRVDGTFSDYAPLYNKPGLEVGQGIVVFGRGTQRGTAIQGGWLWGADDSVERWGQNTVSEVGTATGYGSLLYSTFDAVSGVNEAHLSGGDSGGGVFIHDTDGAWKLAGVNLAVDGPFYTSQYGQGGFNGALYDTSGYYQRNGNTYVPSTGPSGFYASEIASEADYIYSVVPEPSSYLLPAVGAGLLTALRRRRPA